MRMVLNAAVVVEDLRFPTGNHLEELKGDRAGQHSVRINGQRRICFVWPPNGPADVEIVDCHRENTLRRLFEEPMHPSEVLKKLCFAHWTWG
ncbi:MAG: type II toxin-antitoxin system RelE/ParE family toxin [Aliishimia sp.]